MVSIPSRQSRCLANVCSFGWVIESKKVSLSLRKLLVIFSPCPLWYGTFLTNFNSLQSLNKIRPFLNDSMRE